MYLNFLSIDPKLDSSGLKISSDCKNTKRGTKQKKIISIWKNESKSANKSFPYKKLTFLFAKQLLYKPLLINKLHFPGGYKICRRYFMKCLQTALMTKQSSATNMHSLINIWILCKWGKICRVIASTGGLVNKKMVYK